jgi:hypothetical protein
MVTRQLAIARVKLANSEVPCVRTYVKLQDITAEEQTFGTFLWLTQDSIADGAVPVRKSVMVSELVHRSLCPCAMTPVFNVADC